MGNFNYFDISNPKKNMGEGEGERRWRRRGCIEFVESEKAQSLDNWEFPLFILVFRFLQIFIINF